MKRYTQQEKEQAAKRLAETNWDVPLVALELNIPERTLFRWKRKWQDKTLPLPQFPLSFGKTYEDIEEQLTATYNPGEYTDLRNSLMKHIHALTPTLSQDPDLAHRRVLALTRMLDRVLKLEELTRIEKPQISIIKYETPDGYLHDMPYYYNGLHERANRAYQSVIDHARYVHLKREGYSDEELHFIKDVTHDEYEHDSEEITGEINHELEAIFEEPITDEILNKPQYKGFLGSIMARGTGFDPIDSDDNTDNPLPQETDNK